MKKLFFIYDLLRGAPMRVVRTVGLLLMMVLMPLNVSAVNPNYQINSDKLYSEGHVTIRWGTVYESWNPDIVIEHSFDNNFIEISKLDGSDKRVLVRFCKKGDDIYHKYWMHSYDNVLAENCQNYTRLHSDHAYSINNQVEAYIGDDTYAFTRVHIPARYIVSGFKLHIQCRYFRTNGKWLDDYDWGRTWEFKAANVGIKDCQQDLKNNDKLPGFVRFSFNKMDYIRDQYLCFTDQNGKYVSFADPIQLSRDGSIKLVNFVDLNNPEFKPYKDSKYCVYIPVADYTRNVTPKYIAAFSNQYGKCTMQGRKGLITNASQMSSPYTDQYDPKVDDKDKDINRFTFALDNNLNTYWHSDWHNNQPVSPGTHYFEVDLYDQKEGKITACMSRRAGNDNHITSMDVYARNDNENYTYIQKISFPFDTEFETKSAAFYLSRGYRYLKFVITSTTKNQGFGHMTEFQLFDDTSSNICNNYGSNIYATEKSCSSALLGAYVWPKDISYEVDSTGYVNLNWNANVDDLDYSEIIKGDEYNVLRTWQDGTGAEAEEEIGSVTYSYTKPTYTFKDNIKNINITGGLKYRIRRSETADTWQWKYYKEMAVNYVTQLAQLDSVRAFVDEETGKAKITWVYREGIWPDNMKISIYNDLSIDEPNLIKELTSPKEAQKGYFIDPEFATCTRTQYYILVDPGSQEFYYNANEKDYIEPEMVAIGDPLLTTDMGVISNPKASKGYYNDHIDVSFDTKGYFEYYEIYRSSYGSDIKSAKLINTMKNEYSQPVLSYTDNNVTPGAYYNYYIKGIVHCDGKVVESKPLTVVGFATATGTIYGKASFTTGVAVPGVTIYAETTDEDLLSGKSINVPGNENAYLYVDKALELDSAFAIQAYVMPKSDGTIFKLGENTSLTYSGGKYQFAAGGKTVSANRNTGNGDVFEHVTAMLTKDSLKIYVNGELQNFTLGAQYDSINANAIIGQGMKGLIDEVRLWNRTLKDEEVLRDYNRYLHGGENGLLAYWRFNDGIDGEFYDLAHDKDNTYHQYDGVFVDALDADENVIASVEYSDVVPTVGQLAFKGVTDEQGNYTISGLPYTGNGTMYSLRPEMGTHVFGTGANDTPTTTRLISQDTRSYNVDFTDKSSFTVSGYVYYAGGTVPSPGVMFKVDGNLQYDSDGNFIVTDDEGHFSISVPVGIHKVQAYLTNHTFEQDGKIVNLDGSNRNYQDNIENIHLYDNTHIRLIGRVAGGTIQEAYPVGHSLSTNNLGENITLTLKLKSETGKYKIASKDETTVFKHQRVLQLENTKDEDLPQTTMKTSQNYIEITADKNTGEFVADVLPLDYVITSVNVSGHDNLLKTNENLDLRNKFTEEASVNTNEIKDNDDNVISSRVDSVKYNHMQLFIKRVSPTIELAQLNSSKSRTLKYFGDQTKYFTKNDGSEEELTLYDEDKDEYTLGMPVFTTNKKYAMQVFAYEPYQYYNEKGEALENRLDKVPLNEGKLTFQNDLSLFSSIDTLSLDTTGYANYEFTCDEPDVSASGPAKNLTLKLDANDATTLWNGGEAFKAIVVGSRALGNSFLTKGPDQLSFILRDPPGSNSKSYIEKNFTTSHTSSYSWSLDNEGSETSEVSAGADIGFISLLLTPATAVGHMSKKEEKETFSWGIVHTEGGGTGNSSTRTESYTKGYETSDDPAYVGADADLFVGNSTNISYGPSVNIRLISASAFNSASMEKLAETADRSVYLIRDNGITFGIVYGTQFVYTQGHIINNLIPELISVRNNFLTPNTVSDAEAQALAQNNGEQVYRSNVSAEDESFGSEGSYKIFYPKKIKNGKEVSIIDTDTINTLNESITRWEHYLAKNEKEKVLAKKLDVDGNISISSGGTASGSYQYTSASTSTESFSFTIGGKYENDFEVDLGVLGSKITVEEQVTTSHNWDWENSNENSVTVGYEISDSDPNNSYSIDICKYVPWDKMSDEEKAKVELDIITHKNAGTASSAVLEKLTQMTGSYIFRTVGGHSSCPYEGEYVTQYYEPGQHVINAAMVKLEDPNLSVDRTTITQVPSDGKARFSLTMSNGECTDRDASFNLYLDPASNPYGAIVRYGGESLTGNLRSIPINAGEALTQEITVERGSAFDYNNLRLILASECDDNLSSEVLLSVKFQRSAGSICIDSPADGWVLNTNPEFMNDHGEYELPVTISDFDINQKGFKCVALEYKASSASEKDWVTACRFYSDDALYNQDTGTKERIPEDGKLTYKFNMQTLSDRNYDLRAACVAVLDGVETTNYSPVVSGIKDTSRPTIYGNIQPSDGILNYGEFVELTLSEAIVKGALSADKFEVTGVQSISDLLRNASIRFDGVNDCLVTEAETNLSGKDFTIESNIYIDALNNDATFFSYGAPEKAFEVGMTTDKHLTIKSGGKTYTSEKVVDVKTGEWEHIGVMYYNTSHTVEIYYNGESVWNVEVAKPAAKGIFTIGLGADGKNGFCGKMSELRIWSKARSGKELADTRNQSLRPNQMGLISYYPMDEGFGTFVTDKARGANAVMCDAQWFINRDGRAAKLSTEKLPSLEINIGSTPITCEDDFTLEFWFRGDKGQKNVALFSNGQAENEPDAEDHITIGFNESGNLHIKTSEIDHISDLTADNLLNDAWHNLAFVVDRSSSTAKLYVDGAFDSYFNSRKIHTLSSAYATFGCRTNIPNVEGQINKDMYTYDQALNGSIDDIRLWRLAKNSTMIEEQFNKALNGDEKWLLAYYPFEDYADNQGTKEMVYTMSDLSAEGKLVKNIANGNASETKDTAPVQEAGAVQNIEVSWTTNDAGDKIALNRKSGDWNDYDQSTVTFKISDIYDKNNNAVKCPIIFSVFIDQSPLKWEKKEVNLVIPSGEGGEFSVDAINICGETQKFTIENQPSWLGVSTTSGTITASDNTEHIKFTIDPALNTGSYTETVYLVNGDGLARPLHINIKVAGEGPKWNVNPSDYAYSMNIVGQIKIDGEYSTDSEDMIAAFSGDECVGVATNRYNANKGLYYTFLTVYSNSARSAEPLTFRVWDASTGKISMCKASIGDIKFKSNDVKGSIAEPVVFANTDDISEKYEIASGWNWVSFNLVNNSNEVASILTNGKWTSGDEIKNDKYVDSYSTTKNAWIGTLSNHGGVNNTSLFKLKAKNYQTIAVEGKPVDVTKTSISVKKNWNYISYLPTTLMTLKDALAGYDASEGDILKSQSGFAQYDNNNGWVGNVDYMSPGKGYMLKRTASSSTSFKYPSTSSTSSSARHRIANNIDIENEDVQHNYSSNMSIIAAIEGIELQENDEIVAYVHGERRSNASKVSYEGQDLWFVTVDGDDAAGIIFSIERDGETIASTRSSFGYQSDDVRGTLNAPTAISFASAESGVKVSPKVFKTQFAVSIVKPALKNVTVEVYSTTGQMVLKDSAADIQGMYQHTFDGSSLTGGVYLVRVIADGEPTVIRIIKN